MHVFVRNVRVIQDSSEGRFVDLLSGEEKKLVLSFWHWSIINILRFELFIPVVKLNELCMCEGSVANCIFCNYGMDGTDGCLATSGLNSQYIQKCQPRCSV